MNDKVIRSTLNDFVGADGATFEKFSAKLKSMTHAERKQAMIKLSDAVFSYLQSANDNGLVAEVENVQYLVNELIDFTELHEDKCKAVWKKTA